jgi:hypothetical protein
MLYNTQNYWVFGLFSSSGILGTRRHDVSETGSVSVLRCGGEDTYSDGSLRQTKNAKQHQIHTPKRAAHPTVHRAAAKDRKNKEPITPKLIKTTTCFKSTIDNVHSAEKSLNKCVA